MADEQGRGRINAQPQPDWCKLDEREVVGSELIVVSYGLQTAEL